MTKPFNPATDSGQLLRWWHQHQAQWLASEADSVRNGLLQDLFVVRRKLELVAKEDENTLATVERLYHALEHLGDRLSSPYSQESLPLAMQHLLKDWPPQLPLTVNLPIQWSAEPREHVMLLLSVVEHLKQLLVTQLNPPQGCTISLAEEPDHKQFTVQFDSVAEASLLLANLCESNDWAYYLSTFEVLTGGQVRCSHTGDHMSWQFIW